MIHPTAVIGRGVRVGQAAVFKPFVKVGDGARIGMGAVVIRDVPAGEVWAGNPARCIRPAMYEPDTWVDWFDRSRTVTVEGG